MKKLVNLNEEINVINSVVPFMSNAVVGDVTANLTVLSQAFSGGKIEIVMAEKDFYLIGAKVVEAFKNCKAETKLLLIEDKDFNYTEVRSSFNSNVGAVIAVGDKNLLSAVRYYSSIHSVPCFAVVTTPFFEKVFAKNVYLKTENVSVKMPAEHYKKVYIDPEIISKAQKEYFAKSYVSVISKLTSLIDYKLNCFLSGESVDNKLFALLKRAVNIVASLLEYQNYKHALIVAELYVATVNAYSDFLSGTGVEVLKEALSIFAPNLKGAEKSVIAFEKTAKIYHMFFTNDFSDLLSSPDYLSDLELLVESTKRDRAVFSKNLKIPGEKRRRLINLLLEKTRDDFKRETSLIMSILPAVKSVYQAILQTKEKPIISYKQIKNAVTVAPYLTDKTSALTLCRDMGVLKCAN